MTPLPAAKALDSFYLEARGKLLELAAILDRIDRGSGAKALAGDQRLEMIRGALQALEDGRVGRAERVQRIFSLDYDAGWQKPEPEA